MIDGGLIMLVTAAVVMLLSPAERAIAHRRWVRQYDAGQILRVAFSPPPAFEQLLTEIDRVWEADAMVRGIRDISDTYSAASRG